MRDLIILLKSLSLHPYSRLFSLACLSFLSTVSEVLGLMILKALLELFQERQVENILIFAIAFLFVVKVIASIFLSSAMQRKLYTTQTDISNALFNLVLSMRYDIFRKYDSDFYLRSLIQLPYQIVVGGLLPLSIVIVDSMVIIAIVIYSYVTIGASSIFIYLMLFSTSAIIYFRTKSTITYSGKSYNAAEKRRTGNLTTIISDVKFYMLNKQFERICSTVIDDNTRYSNALCNIEIYKTIPRYWIELSGVILLLTAICSNKLYANTFSLAKLALLGIFLFRLTPSLNRLIGSVNYLKFLQPSIRELAHNVEMLNSPHDSNAHLSISTMAGKVNCSIEYYGKRRIDFSISMNCLNYITAPSGWGKTHLLDTLSGLYLASGESFIEQLAFTNHADLDLYDQAYITQNCRINEGLYLKQLLDESSFDLEYYEQIITYFMPDYHEKVVNGFDTYFGPSGYLPSGGETKKIILASVLAFRPKVLFLDEVTSGLDQRSLKLVSLFVEQYARLGNIVFITAHVDSFGHDINRIRLD
jgi:ABC-type bacteriocin/lantibiotic exporter with double-glycine peptidase domain